MLNFKLFINDQDALKKFGKYTKIYGIVFIVLGLIGMAFPGLASLTTAIFFGWLLLLGGFVTAVQTWHINRGDWLGWFKTIVFTATGAMIIVNPLPGVLALGVLFSIYFMLDAAANFMLGWNLKPAPGWWIALVNSAISIFLALIFLEAIGNPLKTLWLVGLMVGISLFFDGIMLLVLSKASEKGLDDR
jgi:uncharacterized membrane protein HdeD (DUF308 family)